MKCIAALFALLLVPTLGSIAWGQDFSSWHKFTQAELLSETGAVAANATATVGLHLRLEPGWHAYWVNPGDSGAPVHMKFNNGRGVHVARVMFPYPHRFETGPLVTFGYEREVMFPIELEIGPSLHPGDKAHIEVAAEWLVCKDVCIPAFQTFQLDVPVKALEDIKPGPDFALFQRVRQQVPRVVPDFPHYREAADGVHLSIGAYTEGYDFDDFFPFKASGVTNEAPVLKGEAKGLDLVLNKANVPRAKDDRVGVLIQRRKAGGQVQAIQFGDSGWSFEESKPAAVADGLWWMLLSAFFGGLILNLMPCVFPILSIKLLSLLKLSEAHPREVRAQNWAYVFGVLTSFVFIAGILSILRGGGALIGWGFQLQSPVFLSLLVWLFFVLSLNLFGAFEFELFDAGVGGRLTRMGGLGGSFFTGVLAVIVASPCTAPFMGVALGFGLAQPASILLAIFVCLGLGLAFPYIVFAVFPSWIRVLPRPGIWMMRVKQVMAVPLLLTCLWLLWVLMQVQGPTAVWIVLGGAVALAFAVWLSEHRWRKLAQGLTVLILLAGLGLIYSHAAVRSAADAPAADGIWKPYSPQALETVRAQGAFVNMTADWCLTCKVNERLVFSDKEVQDLLAAKKIALLKGDWTQRNEDITLFLNRYERVGVPFYVLYSPRHPGGQPLPEVLTKSIFMDWIRKEFP